MQWDDMLDRVHIDEKWFYLTIVNPRYYLWHDKAGPARKCASKRHIIKVMFLTAVASKNRARGTPVTTPVTVTKAVYRDYLLRYVIPTIKEVWPSRRSRPIFIQQENARPHVEVDDDAVTLAGCSDCWKFLLVAQPAMSPDFNVLDLGFFNLIQSLQHREVVTGIDDLVAAVHRAFGDLDWRVLDKTFVTLQRVMGESLKMGGDNSFKLPHTTRTRMQELVLSLLSCVIQM
ncbi:hypothetical protein H310_01940 [Aphanomyces invadans]|uniref:Tc1-like transposase DDE domain-containing protein n=1 Tax=Aphanomyces invadans TaxID=157072 RepID=A0A024UNM2_9STRA|nr:hypothetical protein H310_01940 [Aphanomyces invadans]ETW07417.1 hypothetical protein H310_01940 [Aphanomyces invadans]|eukprot:XP_008863510.1 hypothetical protein H310_01940 [Aphanomyces invadans]